jgi:hypothetical protein
LCFRKRVTSTTSTGKPNTTGTTMISEGNALIRSNVAVKQRLTYIGL